MWDMIDTNNEGGTYPDDTDSTMQNIVGHFEGMTCTRSPSEYGDDDTCNESTKPVGGNCTPSTDGSNADPVTPMTSTKDSYNIYDFTSLLTGSQYDERWLNCVQEAGD